jgi:hypothetical protein
MCELFVPPYTEEKNPTRKINKLRKHLKCINEIFNNLEGTI